MCLKSVSLAGYHGKAGWCSVPVFVRRRVAGQRSWQSLASKRATTLNVYNWQWVAIAGALHIYID